MCTQRCRHLVIGSGLRRPAHFSIVLATGTLPQIYSLMLSPSLLLLESTVWITSDSLATHALEYGLARPQAHPCRTSPNANSSIWLGEAS
jgi:hypothetical protein